MAKSYEDYYKELLAKNNADGDKQIADYGSIIDKQTSATNKTIDDAMNFTTGQYDTKIGETKQDYEELYDVNEVQKKINERNVAERMANLGLTDSGLNRTQQTAIQLSHGNARTNLSISEQKAVDTLKNELAAKLADYTAQKQTNLSNAEASKAQYALDVRDAARTNAAANATELYNQQVQAENELRIAQIEAAVAAEKARIEAAAKQATTYKSDYKTEKSDLYNYLKDNKENIDKNTAAELVLEFCKKHQFEIDEKSKYGGAELSPLLLTIGMTYKQLEKYRDYGTTYLTVTDYVK